MGGPAPKPIRKIVKKVFKPKPKPKPKPKSVEQPKVAAQMDNSDIKSKNIIADKMAPTDAETSLRNKKKGRRQTIMTSVTGVDEYPTLSKKTLLGG
jgi:outer membrane biosynthesis protein TonB